MPAPITIYSAQDIDALFSGRTRLTSNLSIFVRSDGNDSNDGMANTPASAFLTLQRAIDFMFDEIDLAGFECTAFVADGSYSGTISKLWPALGGIPKLRGNVTDPSLCVLTADNGQVFDLRRHAALDIGGFKMGTTTAGNCLHISSGAVLAQSEAVEFGACAGTHIATNGGNVAMNAPYKITGGAHYHLVSNKMGNLQIVAGQTIDVVGNPAFIGAFAYAYDGGLLKCTCTFSGAATGKRWSVDAGLISCGGNNNFFPGDVAGGPPANYGVYK
jgi:hypothetical protein